MKMPRESRYMLIIVLYILYVHCFTSTIIVDMHIHMHYVLQYLQHRIRVRVVVSKVASIIVVLEGDGK